MLKRLAILMALVSASSTAWAAWAYLNRGLAYRNKSDYERAISDYKKAIEIDPNQGAAYNNLANVYQAQGRYVDAEPLYKRALVIRENTLRTHGRSVQIGRTPRLTGRLPHARRSFVETQGSVATIAMWLRASTIWRGFTIKWVATLDAEPLYKRALVIRAYRLLTEAEREYIARAGTATPYWWGMTVSREQANFDTQPRPSTSPRDTTAPAWERGEPGVAVGRTQAVGWGLPNPWGIFQVHGNVADWVQDCWNPDYSHTPTDGSAAHGGDCTRRVVRGGAWSSWAEDIRAAYREMAGEGDRFYSVGFRVARDLGK